MRYQLKFLQKQGFSMTELLVTLGTVSVLVLVLASFTQNVFSTFVSMDKSKSISETVTLVRMTFATSEQCTLNLKNQPLSLSNPAGSTITSLDIFDLQSGTRASQIVTTGQNLGGVTLESIKITPGRQVEIGLMTSTLEMAFRPSGNASSSLTYRFFPVMSRVQSGVVTECWLRKDQAEADSSQLCSVLSSGSLTYYDKLTGTCVLPSSKWFSGSSSEASCPAGTIFPPTANVDANCNVNSPTNFIDSFPPTVLVYSDGSTNAMTRPPVILGLDTVSKKCRCDWATDINAATLAAMRCQILCLVP